jgi:diguanylate cyclase (GGDEF)-like protein
MSPGAGLRARWRRAFAVLLLLVIATGAVAAAGTHVVVTAYRQTAQELEADAGVLADLQGAIVAHAAASLAARAPDDRARQAELGERVRTGFATAAATAAAADDERMATELRSASVLWASLAATVGAPDATGRPAAVLQVITDEVPKVLDTVADAAEATRQRARADLDRGARLERWNLAGCALLVLLAVGMVLRFARRLTTEVFQPVAELRDSTNLLAAGHLDRRVEDLRDDELGELARSVNAMADAVAASQARLTHTANHDALTGLVNRLGFRDELHRRLGSPTASAQPSVVFLGLDDFKDVNDRLGHAAGDVLLQVVARRLTALVRPGDLVARLGGDEFALLSDLPDEAAAQELADRACQALGAPVTVLGETLQIAASAGVAVGGPGDDLEGLLQRADLATYDVKSHRPPLPRPRSGT